MVLEAKRLAAILSVSKVHLETRQENSDAHYLKYEDSIT